MSVMRPRGIGCENMNHRRKGAPVSHCPQCGGLVNPDLPRTKCDAEKHAAARRRQSEFCVDCGEMLIHKK